MIHVVTLMVQDKGYSLCRRIGTELLYEILYVRQKLVDIIVVKKYPSIKRKKKRNHLYWKWLEKLSGCMYKWLTMLETFTCFMLTEMVNMRQ